MTPRPTVMIVDGPLPAAERWTVAGAGALACFEGVVRGEEEGCAIAGLDYQSYDPMAAVQLQRLAEEAVGRFGLLGLAVAHSRGFVPTGGCSLRLRVAARHRKEALAAMDWYIDALKRDVPIWKRVASGEGGESCR